MERFKRILLYADPAAKTEPVAAIRRAGFWRLLIGYTATNWSFWSRS